MTEFVRVELANGSKASVPVAVAKTADIKPLEGEKALDHRGRPRDVEFPAEAESADKTPAAGEQKQSGRAPSIFGSDDPTPSDS